MARYDEDLHENLFFQTLVGKYSNLFNSAAENRWLICVPRCDTVCHLKLSRTDFENHILRPSNPDNSENNNSFISLNNKQAIIDGETVKVGQGYKEMRLVKILFDECFFNSREESYQVFCLEQPMEGAMGDNIMITLRNLEDCNKFLWGEPGSDKVRRSVDRLIDFFQLVERGTTMRPIMDAASAVYTRAVQEIFKIRKFQVAMQKSFCKLAVETYVMAGLHKKIFKEVCFTVAQKDAHFNKITRNLSDTSPHSLGIKSEFSLVLPKARAILYQLNQFTTPLEKFYCFSSTISTLTTRTPETSHEVVTADELLPILVYLVIVTDIPNWNGNLTYINRFHFSNVTHEEFTYYLTSFEAAVEYVRSEHGHLASKAPSFINHATVQRLRTNSTSGEEEARQFFNLISEGNVSAVKQLLEKAQMEKSSYKSRLCHPLCECPKCVALIDKQLDDSDRASVFLRDQEGRTGLHYAALMGHNELVQLLMEHGAIVTATDHNSSTPLHLSCLKGHQKCTLLLLGEGSCINATDNHGNTPLHQACSNGHEECVKALLFHVTTQCNVNVSNEQGDTPLHNAARWGYASIVSELLGMGAYPHIQNRRREIPQQCAQSRKVQELLSSVQLDRKKGLAGEDKKGGGAGGRGGGEKEGGAAGDESPVIIRNRRINKRMSLRESTTEVDRQLKKLFRAIQDGDTNLVRYIFGWEESTGSVVSPGDFCHPLCQCDRCSKLRKRSSATFLSVNCSDMVGYTPLHKACLLGNHPLVDLFLRHGAFLDSRTRDNEHTPLHLACQYNHKDVVLLLLEHTTQVDLQDSLGSTPLHLACNNGHMETAALLLMHGADVTITNNRGDTPLHNAARWNHPALVNELLLYGASYTATNNEHKTPLDLSNDDQVKGLIHKAARGFIAVGSYTPLHPRSNSIHRNKGTTHHESSRPQRDSGKLAETSQKGDLQSTSRQAKSSDLNMKKQGSNPNVSTKQGRSHDVFSSTSNLGRSLPSTLPDPSPNEIGNSHDLNPSIEEKSQDLNPSTEEKSHDLSKGDLRSREGERSHDINVISKESHDQSSNIEGDNCVNVEDQSRDENVNVERRSLEASPNLKDNPCDSSQNAERKVSPSAEKSLNLNTEERSHGPSLSTEERSHDPSLSTEERSHGPSLSTEELSRDPSLSTEELSRDPSLSTEERSHEASLSPVEVEHRTLGDQAMPGHGSLEERLGEEKGEEEHGNMRTESELPRSKPDENLISLLQAIEAFDRSTLNRRSAGTDDRSAPYLSPSITPPYSPLHNFYPPPLDEEMQTTGLGMSGWSQGEATPLL